MLQAMDRRRFLLGTAASTALACRRASECKRKPGDPASKIDCVFRRRHEQRLFDGEALVAEAGAVIYRGGVGLADRDARHTYTPDTPSCLASVSKPFTAVTVMMLVEQG